ncbi:lipin/Ned1/Smp2 family protein [Gynuella sunshinyii]|uniref:Uncharacterized protein involved in plasmid maintenance n=1 Tax=Gynuella sunshinyii YC6258 TaxID=1445510 RepID=A0A0C5VJ92_9GAMM|nr:haloacid dehalogenase [Gynuella sunshinyii]AJQ94331.1 uncharacterized protein involved in plasmid maintenance [Gynuella sunshinyii YC6258]
MRQFFIRTIITLTMTGLSTLSQAFSCPDLDSVYNSPEPPQPEKISFKHLGSKILSSFYQPYHMVHDEVVAAGDTGTMVGKFDYDIFLHKDLEDEQIYAYIYGTGMSDWEYLGSYRTDSDGKVYVPAGDRDAGEYLVRMVVAGDLTSATGYLSVVEPGTEAILFDIDGTLTLTDFEAVGDYLGIRTALTHSYAIETVNAYKDKKYRLIYLTGRPYWLAKDTREWFDIQQIPSWHLHTNPYGDGPIPPDTQDYKTAYIQKLIDNGVNIIRAYGNAQTDIGAYAAAGIPKEETYIIGQFAGTEDTQAIDGDYSYHFATVVADTPMANCQP